MVLGINSSDDYVFWILLLFLPHVTLDTLLVHVLIRGNTHVSVDIFMSIFDAPLLMLMVYGT